MPSGASYSQTDLSGCSPAQILGVSAVGFVTCTEIGGIADDDERLASAIRDADVPVRAVVWDSEDPPRDVDAFIIRSPWNYHLTPEAFLTWVDRAANSAVVWNDPQIVRWDSHKEYLFELGSVGLPVAETVLCHKHEAPIYAQ